MVDALVLGVRPGDLHAALAGFPPDFSLNDATASASSAVLMNPSPIRAARSSAFGPNAET